MSPFPCHFVSQPPPELPIISCLVSPSPPKHFVPLLFPQSFCSPPSPIHFMPVTLFPILCFPSTSPSSFVFFDLSQIILSPFFPSPDIAIPLDKFYQNLLRYPMDSAVQALNDRAWGPCLESPKLFGRISGDIILLYLQTKASRGTKLILIFIPFTTYEKKKTSLAE